MSADQVVAFGDRALRFPLSDGVDRRALLAALRDVAGVVDVVLAEDTGAVMLGEGATIERARVKDAVAATLARAWPATTAAPALHVVRVVYDGDDLADVASSLGVRTDDVVELHSGRDYEVAMLGFLPGFAYLRGLDPRLVLPRRPAPRARVPAGSVAIAAEYTGIYPLASPGGWNLLGHAVGPPLFDARGAALALGDRVRFERGDASELRHVLPATAAPDPATAPHLEVVKAHGPALVVDGGRVGHMHEGVPHGGPMAPSALARANAAAGNAPGSPAVEIYGALEVIARRGSVAVADDARGAILLDEGEKLAVATEGRTRVRYLAVSGGLDVPMVLDGRGTLLVAAIGGYAGRPLKRGDRLASATPREGTALPIEASPSPARSPIPILPGPDADARVLEAITQATFTIGAQSDRIGTRLDGPALPPHPMHDAHDRKSRPMVRGAIEVTPAGLVVLGPDHPTTGGYPVVAVVAEHAVGDLMARPIGAAIQLSFTP